MVGLWARAGLCIPDFLLCLCLSVFIILDHSHSCLARVYS